MLGAQEEERAQPVPEDMSAVTHPRPAVHREAGKPAANFGEVRIGPRWRKGPPAQGTAAAQGRRSERCQS